MKLEIINPATDPRWDRFVQAHPYGQIGHLAGWCKALEKSFRHIKGHYLVLLEGSGQNIAAGLPLYEVKSYLTGCRLVSIPFTTLCDLLATSSEEAQLLLDHVSEMIATRRCGYAEIRCLNSGALIEDASFGKQEYYVNHFLRLDAPLEKIQKSFHRTCIVQRIRRAEKSGMVLKKGAGLKDLADFYAVYVDARKRIKRPPLPFRFLQAIWDEFAHKDQVGLLSAQKNGETLAGIIFFKFGKRVTIEFAASVESAWNISPNHLLFWEAIKMAHAEGYEIVDFGRTAPNNLSLMDFKRRWGAQTMTMPYFYLPGQMAPNMAERETSLQHRVIQTACSYLPNSVLPLVGNFCYRHLS